MSYIRWKDDLWPSILFGTLVNAPPEVCSTCNGLGLIPEQIDEERYPVMVPCWRCQMHCAVCQKWVAKDGHTCASPGRRPA